MCACITPLAELRTQLMHTKNGYTPYKTRRGAFCIMQILLLEQWLLFGNTDEYRTLPGR